MSEATVKALTDAIYDAYQDSGLLDELDNEQVYEVARLAAQTVGAAGTVAAAIPEGHAKINGQIVRLKQDGVQAGSGHWADDLHYVYRIVEAVQS